MGADNKREWRRKTMDLDFGDAFAGLNTKLTYVPMDSDNPSVGSITVDKNNEMYIRTTDNKWHSMGTISQKQIKCDSIGTTTTQKYLDLEGLKKFKERLLQEIYSKPLVKQTCHSCGATLTVDSEKHIFRCSYCGSCYAIGTQMIAGR